MKALCVCQAFAIKATAGNPLGCRVVPMVRPQTMSFVVPIMSLESGAMGVQGEGILRKMMDEHI